MVGITSLEFCLHFRTVLVGVAAVSERAKRFSPYFVNFSQPGASFVGRGPLILAFAHVRQSIPGAESSLQKK